MSERKRNKAEPASELLVAADEELRAACTLTWAALSRVVPWGDRYEGFASGGGEVIFERNYVWANEPGGDILCEVTVFRGETRYDSGARAQRLIPKPSTVA